MSMEKSTVRLRVANISDIGKNPSRVTNEDFFGYYEGEYGQLFLVCDGMGGHEGGEVASRLAVESIRNYFETNFLAGEELTTITQSIDFAQQKILEEVRNNPNLSGMGSTLVLLLINGQSFWKAHSGDSRIYLSRGGSLNQLTKDHSEVQGMVDTGIITQEQAATHPRRNFITKALGHSSYAPEVSGPHLLQQDDVFLLCSDGLTEYLRDEELHQQMDEEPAIACRNLVDTANDRGGQDNITLQIVHVLQCSPFSVRETVHVTKHRHLLPPLGVIATILIFLGAVIWYSLSLKKDPVAPTPKAKVKVAEVKKAAPKPKEKPTAEQPALEKAIDQKLGATDAGKAYQDLFAKLTTASGQAKRLKFINNPTDKQMVYVLPGQTVYLAFDQLQDKAGYNMKKDEIEALIALALVKSAEKSVLNSESWEMDLFASGSAVLDDKTFNAARELYKKYDPENADFLFNNDARFGKFRKLMKAGTYNISIDLPKKK